MTKNPKGRKWIYFKVVFRRLGQSQELTEYIEAISENDVINRLRVAQGPIQIISISKQNPGFLDKVFGTRTYSAKSKEWTSSKHKSGVPGWEKTKKSKKTLAKSDDDLQKLFSLQFDNEKDLKKAVGKATKRKKNGFFDSSAEELAEGFHGRKSLEEYDIVEQEEYVKNQAVIGFLEEFEILSEDLQGLTPINFPHEDHRSAFARKGKKSDTVFVTFPNRNHLEFHGGNQELPVDDNKKLVKIGPVWGICYWTDKHHLSDGTGFSSYHHNFGEESVKGNSEKPSLALVERRLEFLPTLVYDTVNKKVLLVGGSYSIEDEGIRN